MLTAINSQVALGRCFDTVHLRQAAFSDLGSKFCACPLQCETEQRMFTQWG